jgi:hypothetical protein
MEIKQKHLYDLILMDSPEAILDEARVILKIMMPDFIIKPVEDGFNTTLRLFAGEYPGYRACNTGYHDVHHALAAFLTTTRLIHGAVIKGQSLTMRAATVALVAALFHDAGYIQQVDDKAGSGAKYTATHVDRSIALFELAGPSWGLSNEEISQGRTMILCTELTTDISAVSFADNQTEFLARILAVGDLIGQRADRAYPEKLLLLYDEFKEGNVGDLKDEIAFLRDSIDFADFARDHIKKTLDKSSEYLCAHFEARWGISEDLYKTATIKNNEYIKEILSMPDTDPVERLRRGYGEGKYTRMQER